MVLVFVFNEKPEKLFLNFANNVCGIQSCSMRFGEFREHYPKNINNFINNLINPCGLLLIILKKNGYFLLQ